MKGKQHHIQTNITLNGRAKFYWMFVDLVELCMVLVVVIAVQMKSENECYELKSVN